MAVWTPPKKLKTDGGIGYPIRTDHLTALQDSIYDLIARSLTEAIAGFNMDDSKAVLIKGIITKNPSTYNLEVIDALVAWAGKIYYIPTQEVANVVGPYTGYYMTPSVVDIGDLMWRDGSIRPTMCYDILTITAYDDYSNDPPSGTLRYENIITIGSLFWPKQDSNYTVALLNNSWVHENLNPVKYKINQFGQLYLIGRFKLKDGGLQNDPLFQLPVGARPSKPLYLTLFADAGGIPELPIRIMIDKNGVVGGVHPYDTISRYYYAFNHVLPL